jgi:hypothetical protein
LEEEEEEEEEKKKKKKKKNQFPQLIKTLNLTTRRTGIQITTVMTAARFTRL